MLDLQVDVLQSVHRLGFALEGFGQMIQLNERQNGSTPFNTCMWVCHVLVTRCIISELRHIGKHVYCMIGHRMSLYKQLKKEGEMW